MFVTLYNNNNQKIKIHLSTPNQKQNQPKKAKAKKEPPKFVIQFKEVNPQFTFKNFTVHEGNNLAHALLCKMTGYEQNEHKLIPGKTALAEFNPIYLHGPTGTGKTHLLMATAHALKDRSLNVLYSHADLFTEHVVSAIRAGEMSSFRKTYRNVDVLILDDVHIFSRKRATQEELFHSFNALHLAEKQIILGSNCSPAELQHIEQRLVSRFEWGVVLGLDGPTKENSRLMIEQKANTLNFPLPPKIIEFLINTFSSNTKALIQGLEALILRNHLQTLKPQKLYPNQLTIPLVKHLLTDLILEENRRLITPSKIIQTVANHFEMEENEMTGQSQSRACVLPRQLAMYLCRDELKLSYTKIGDLFSRDHTTVMASVKVIQKNKEQDNLEVLKHLSPILKKLKNSH